MSTEYVGIDYSLGKANYDKETGIHYGVISQHAINQDILIEFEIGYLPEDDDFEETQFYEQDYESNGMTYNQDGYIIEDCLDSDLIVLKSPYYTYCQFCSPCVPGAGNLEFECPNGVKTYCLGLDWYDDYNPMPYKHLWEVATGKQIQ